MLGLLVTGAEKLVIDTEPVSVVLVDRLSTYLSMVFTPPFGVFKGCRLYLKGP